MNYPARQRIAHFLFAVFLMACAFGFIHFSERKLVSAELLLLPSPEFSDASHDARKAIDRCYERRRDRAVFFEPALLEAQKAVDSLHPGNDAEMNKLFVLEDYLSAIKIERSDYEYPDSAPRAKLARDAARTYRTQDDALGIPPH